MDREVVPQSDPDEPGQDRHQGGKLVETARRTDRSPRLFRAARFVRHLMPGDSELGDPLSTAGAEPSYLLARRLSEAGEQRPSVVREVGLGALQVWQAMSEAQGRGRGDRELAILFTDLVDFSAWALKAGDEAALELLRRVGRVAEPAIAAGHGRIVKRLGDGLMAVFDEPDAAVEAACEACRDVGRLDLDGYTPALRAGLHIGRPRKLGGDYLGVDVNIAARVAEAASGGEVLISGAVRERLADDDFRLRRRRRFSAKGAPKGLEVYSAERVAAESEAG